MSPVRPRVVYDTMIYIQSLASTVSVASRCLDLWSFGFVELWVSRDVMLEIGDVLTRPVLQAKFPLVTDDRAYELTQRLRAQASFLSNPATAVWLPRDPKDQPHLDLATTIGADFLVTWNHKHLGYLMDQDEPECVEFRRRFPAIKIVDPVKFVTSMRSRLP